MSSCDGTGLLNNLSRLHMELRELSKLNKLISMRLLEHPRRSRMPSQLSLGQHHKCLCQLPHPQRHQLQQYLHKISTCTSCTDIDSNCLTCVEGSCLTCYTNYKPDSTSKKCVLQNCKITNCVNCANSTACSTCASGFAVNPSDGTCVADSKSDVNLGLILGVSIPLVLISN